ncbi:MAG: hypothetical protein H8E26_14260 [FCB group bacterium]|nr:hypothetical protein [FCB group bacterium]MBL7027448.1 hypothetical protein [Candidatus Neomarinimicrobiota bacterium]MBL7122061.1 hypothetical protein [Candidatus Neomarinimicrobiota bacterium]
MDAIQTAVYKTIHQGKLNIPELADTQGLTENSIYKMALEDSGTVKNLKRVVSLIMLQGRDDILIALNQRVGRLSIKIPRTPKNKEEESEVVANYQQLANDTVGAMLQHFAKPSQETMDMCVSKLTEITQTSIGIQKRIENGNQLSFLDDKS